MNDLPAEALPEAFLLDAAAGQRFCLFHRAQGSEPKGRILYLHPFAEEMNASRRVVAQQCRAFAASGYPVLQIDLLGCGDSSGDFGDATWAAWVQDALLGLQWLRQHTQGGPTWIWGLRAGALLACATAREWLARHADARPQLLLWQPVASGQQQLQQFLRLHAAAQWLGRDAAGEPPATALAAGRHGHVAGYSLSPTLAAELEQARLDLPLGPGRVVLMELPALSSQTDTPPPAPQPALQPSLSPWALRQQGSWQTAGWQVNALAVGTPPFWSTVVESSLAPALEQATRQALRGEAPTGEPP